MAAYGLYTHIQSNRRRSIVLLAGLFVLVYLMVFAGALVAEVLADGYQSTQYYLSAAGRDLLAAAPFATIATLIWIAIAYFFHQKMIDALTGASTVQRTDAPRIYNLLENLCISRGMPMPKLKILPSEALNAYASGLNERQYAVTVTSGLVDALDDAELEAVLAHELTHIRNGDVRMMIIAVIIAGVVGFVGEIFFRSITRSSFGFGNSGTSRPTQSSSDGRKSSAGGAFVAILIAVIMVAIAWLLSQVIRFALSRSREYLADAGAVELTKQPDAMISALRKIENRGELKGATSAVMELCVDNPRQGFADIFATHPSIEKRVAALVRFTGGHDPGPLSIEQPEAPADIRPVDEAAAPPKEDRPFESPWTLPPQRD